jgi:hypothetical protein
MFVWILWELNSFFHTPTTLTSSTCWYECNFVVLARDALYASCITNHRHDQVVVDSFLFLRVFWPKVSSRYFVWIYRVKPFLSHPYNRWLHTRFDIHAILVILARDALYAPSIGTIDTILLLLLEMLFLHHPMENLWLNYGELWLSWLWVSLSFQDRGPLCR